MKKEPNPSGENTHQPQNLLELLPLAAPIFSGASLAYTVSKDAAKVIGARPGEPLILQVLNSSFLTETQQHRLLLKLVSGSLHGITVESMEFEFGWGPIQAAKIDVIEFEHYVKEVEKAPYTLKEVATLKLDSVERQALPNQFPISIPSGSVLSFYAYLNEIERKNLAKESGGEVIFEYAQFNNAKSLDSLKSPVRLVW